MGDTITLTLEKSLSIDQIYNQVKDHDLVLTVDAPLADALNARLTTPRLGHFATTPRRLALDNLTGEQVIEDKRKLFLKIIEETDLNWKHAAYLLQNVISCWKETGRIKKILDHNRFDSEETRTIIKILTNTINPYSALTRYKVPNDVSTAVIAPHQFTALDKEILPNDHDTINIFTKDQHTLPEFKIFNSTTEIIQAILNNIEDPKDTAVVMGEDSPYRYPIEAAFRTHNIPYMVSTDFKDDEDLRTYLKLLRFGLSHRGLKLKDVKPILYHLNEPASVKKDEFYIEHLDEDYLSELKQLLNDLSSMTFEESVKKYEELLDQEQEELRTHLELLDLKQKKVTEANLNSFEYYLDSFDITTESAGRGVLIASPWSSTYIDRPIVFYLGMDSSWTPEPPTDPWVEKSSFDQRKKKDFKILMQNGEEQFFLVQDKILDQHVTPSYYFNDLTNKEIEKFTDFDHSFYGTESSKSKKAFEKQPTNIEPKEVKTLSQSSLNVLAYCPKDYFFNKLIDSPKKDYFMKGSLMHHFAEFYIHHPKFVESQPEGTFLELMVKQISPYIDDLARDSWKTQFKIGIENLKKYLDPDEDYKPLPGYQSSSFSNFFSTHFDKPIEEPITEAYFKNYDVGASGVVDLIKSKDHIVDHKSGNKKSINQIMKLSDIEDIEKKPNFQTKMYIAHHRSIVPNTPITFTFYHMLNNVRDVISGEGNIHDNILDINYYPQTFNEMIQKEMMFDHLIDGVSEKNNRRKTLEKIGYENYKRFFEDKDLPQGDKDDVLESKLTEEFILFCEDIIDNNYKYITRGCKSAIKKLVYFRNQNYFKNDIDEFETYLKEQINKLNRYKQEGFPIHETDEEGEPLRDIDPDELENKDLVIL
ncbi:MAG: PD-(D/E)XK nuclease family protein [Thermoplasmatota archaeon]